MIGSIKCIFGELWNMIQVLRHTYSNAIYWTKITYLLRFYMISLSNIFVYLSFLKLDQKQRFIALMNRIEIGIFNFRALLLWQSKTTNALCLIFSQASSCSSPLLISCQLLTFWPFWPCTRSSSYHTFALRFILHLCTWGIF